MTIVECKTLDGRTIQTDRADVMVELNKILQDQKFVASPMMALFLRFVVEQTLAGEANRIKAYTVAVEALGKPCEFDPQRDPSVRVMAKRLRATLDDYYDRTDNHEVVIKLRSGSYVPDFEPINVG